MTQSTRLAWGEDYNNVCFILERCSVAASVLKLRLLWNVWLCSGTDIVHIRILPVHETYNPKFWRVPTTENLKMV